MKKIVYLQNSLNTYADIKNNRQADGCCSKALCTEGCREYHDE